MASPFDTALATLTRSVVSVDLVYHPAGDAPAVPLRGWYEQPDLDAPIVGIATRRQRRLVGVRAADLPNPAKGDTIEAPAGSTAARVIDVYARDPQRLTWTLEIAA
ncbi:MAG: hypothetical protein ISS15_05365 [Alphaproteobacteria bacterium]|nr:hypothetical protein [Alphaproteobacteria bacterium]MBL7097068.1 hypothetical protein [Alphaproteobacteria bacterium]